jgi:hypothetical protein
VPRQTTKNERPYPAAIRRILVRRIATIGTRGPTRVNRRRQAPLPRKSLKL